MPNKLLFPVPSIPRGVPLKDQSLFLVQERRLLISKKVTRCVSGDFFCSVA
ncbi:hypothetical protein NBRC111894_4088 [Sporolactobacillus inulinus]|uniref:Uncharacterized protein n=1 Tax=Sporolactobacillus inulinus TaxID=2078 RepID=A0A4Y1ZI00_9BACL|nr:hypothetical protein NBRC111894_4088 [Sporolactobacillus inulinus]